MKRAAIIVIDSMGIGAIEDALEYGDDLTCNTLCNLAQVTGGLNVPNFEKLGLGNIKDIKGVKKTDKPLAKYGIMKMKSKGKDTTTGHWEIAGIISPKPLPVYPDGFPPEIISEFERLTGRKTLCNALVSAFPGFDKETIAALLTAQNIPPQTRGETLDLMAFSRIADALFAAADSDK